MIKTEIQISIIIIKRKSPWFDLSHLLVVGLLLQLLGEERLQRLDPQGRVRGQQAVRFIMVMWHAAMIAAGPPACPWAETRRTGQVLLISDHFTGEIRGKIWYTGCMKRV